MQENALELSLTAAYRQNDFVFAAAKKLFKEFLCLLSWLAIPLLPVGQAETKPAMMSCVIATSLCLIAIH